MKLLLQNLTLAAEIKETMDEFMSEPEVAESVPLYVPIFKHVIAEQPSISDRFNVLTACLLPMFIENVAAAKEVDMDDLQPSIDLVEDTLKKAVGRTARGIVDDASFKNIVKGVYDEHYEPEARAKRKADAEDAEEHPIEAIFRQAIQEVQEESA